MSISCATLFQDVASEVGVGVGNTELANKFIRACNRALDELSISADKATRFTHITSAQATISGLDAEYEYILYAGIIYWLIRMGHRPSDPKIAAVLYADSQNNWQRAKGEYVMAEDNELNATDDEDVIGLGDTTND